MQSLCEVQDGWSIAHERQVMLLLNIMMMIMGMIIVMIIQFSVGQMCTY